VLDYIVAHDGTISLSQASKELALPFGALQQTIERLKAEGFLNQK
jgi:DNA-binding IclR family transcriptional regulator